MLEFHHRIESLWAPHVSSKEMFYLPSHINNTGDICISNLIYYIYKIYVTIRGKHGSHELDGPTNQELLQGEN